MKIVKLNSAQFDKFAMSHKYRNYYQSSMYANVMAKFGYTCQYIGVTNDENKLIGATLLLYKTVFMNHKIAYAPRGVLFDYENDNLEEFIELLKKVLNKQKFMFLRMDPYIPLTVRDAKGNIMNFNNKGNDIIESLKKCGFEYKGKTLHFETEKPRWEGIVILQRDIRDIFSKLDKRTRNKIRKANNSGIEIMRDTSNSINDLFKFVGEREKKPVSFYREMCKNFENNIDIYYAWLNTETFLINSRRSYEKEMEYNDILAEKIRDFSLDEKEKESYINKKMESDKLITAYKKSLLKSTDLLKKYPEGLVVAGAMVIKYDNAAFIFTEGQDDEFSNLYANYLLKWQMIEDYDTQGFKYVNLNAITGDFDTQNEYSGINEAKLGFNTTITEYIGEFDMIINSFTYNWYKKTKK